MSDRFPNRRWVIFNTSETGSIDWSQVTENSSSIRLTNDGSQTFVKYEGDQPSSVTALSSKSQEYTHLEILNVLTGSAWRDVITDPDEE
tara:strand:- start:547 stop:813 length:267 start_codon:yes stop_codon:yes gene_type:complete